ncbi:MAG TPA: helix-turn-helix domain-containing protein [Candidatus Bathyarchaeia archaeon]|nr:helix-turn-helix domain-containing protein [Candidatus Bathyarchaeia archaeon]
MGLYQIWILQESGTCLFNDKFDDSCSDENLISGFLSAVNSFVGSFGAEIKWIETDKNRFVFKKSDQIILVASTDLNDHAPLTYMRLSRIADHFHMMFTRDLFVTNDPIPVDIFRKIGPTVNRIFGLEEKISKIAITRPIIVNKPSYSFDTSEARLLSFIRYKRRVAVSDITRYMKITDSEAQNVLSQLESKRYVHRSEDPDGSEHFGINPILRGAY